MSSLSATQTPASLSHWASTSKMSWEPSSCTADSRCVTETRWSPHTFFPWGGSWGLIAAGAVSKVSSAKIGIEVADTGSHGDEAARDFEEGGGLIKELESLLKLRRLAHSARSPE